ncbi:MAG: chemotaxis protein CheW [Oleibacter sp.]|nr:chemotaxis protein CheW [Thalassolituus sp.]
MTSPFQQLLEIEQRCRQHARALPKKAALGDSWRGVGFLLGEQQFVASMSEVTEILQLPKVTRIPGVKQWVLGVANVRGRLVSIMNLAGLLSQPIRNAPRSQRVLVVEKDDYAVGFLVDAVLGMQSFPVTSELELNALDDDVKDYVATGFERDDKVWPVFRFADLLESQGFLNIAV